MRRDKRTLLMRGGTRKLSFAFVAVLSVLLGASAGRAAKSGWPPSPNCHTAKLIALRGTNDNSSGPLGWLATKIRNELNSRATSVGLDFWGLGVPYPATMLRYEHSKGIGRDRLRAYIKEQVSDCPSEKIAVVGYSQGAHAVGDVFSKKVGGLTRDQLSHVVVVELIADPRFNSKEPFDRGSFNHGSNGRLGARSPGDLVSVADRLGAWCRKNDFYCNSGSSFSAHHQDKYWNDYGKALVDFIWSHVSGHVYWVDASDGTVNKVPIGGGPVTTLASGQNGPFSVAVDGTHVYWANAGGATVNEVPVGGGNVTTLASGQNGLRSVAADGAHVYWSTNDTVREVSVGGGSVTTLARGQNGALSVAVDRNHVYWVNYWDGTVNEVPVGGGPVTTLANGQNGPYSVAVDSTHVYWTDPYSGGTVNEVPVGGGSVTTLASGQFEPFSVAVDGTHVYWASADGVNEVPVGGGSVTTLASDDGGAPISVAVDGTHVFWADPYLGMVNEVPVGGGTVTTLASGQKNPSPIAVGP